MDNYIMNNYMSIPKKELDSVTKELEKLNLAETDVVTIVADKTNPHNNGLIIAVFINNKYEFALNDCM